MLYKKKHPGIFEVISGPGLGVGAARQKGIEAVKTEFLAFLDSDDWYVPEALETLSAHIDKTGAVCGTICKVYFNGRRGIQRRPASEDCLVTHAMVRKANPLPMSAVMYRTELLCRVGGVDPNLVRMEDLDLHLRVTHVTDYYFTAKILVYYQVPDQAGMLEKTFTYAKWEAIVWRKHGFIHWQALFRALANCLINTLLIPVNLVRRIRRSRAPIFRDVYLRILVGYIVGLMTGYRFKVF